MKICLNLTKISKGYLDFEKKEKCNFRYSGGGQLTPIIILWTKIESVSLEIIILHLAIKPLNISNRKKSINQENINTSETLSLLALCTYL